MQSGYGGVSEMQQFLVDGCAPTLFSMSTPPPPSNPTAAPDIHAAASPPSLKYHPHHQSQPPPPPLHFPHFHHIPITQQLFQQTHHHQFQLFHPHPHQQPQDPRRMIPQHQLGFDQESGRENSSSPTRMIGGRGGATGEGGGGGPPSFLAAAMNFKLAVNESSGGGSREGLNDEEGILHGDDGSESRFHPWHREEDAGIKEPFWRPLDIDYINRNNKRCKDKEAETSTNSYCKKSKEGSEPGQGTTTTGNNYKLFSELEAIYKPGGSITAAGCGNHQTGSGSALTGDENPLVTPAVELPPGDPHAGTGDLGSDTSTGGGEAPPPASKFPKAGGRRKRKRRQQLTSIAVFFEGLVKQLMEHQESLHRKFLEVMERRDQERTSREEAWRRQEAAKSSREAAARDEERALAVAREAAIVSFLEKLTGETLNLPTKSQFQSLEQKTEHNTMELVEHADVFKDGNADTNSNRVQLSASRWPRAEVHALIRVRSGLEPRFQEPGLKGPLWEEVSSTMTALGYHRGAKRCKEKWENINKYFRKTKDSGKKRPQQSKTCPYFHQLDQLYSNSHNKLPLPPPAPMVVANPAAPGERRDNSELLDAIVVSTDNPSFKFPEMGSLGIDFGDNAKAGGSEFGGNNEEEVDAADNNEERVDDEEEEEEEGESQADLWQQRLRS